MTACTAASRKAAMLLLRTATRQARQGKPSLMNAILDFAKPREIRLTLAI
jgi:hypothetical protein